MSMPNGGHCFVEAEVTRISLTHTHMHTHSSLALMCRVEPLNLTSSNTSTEQPGQPTLEATARAPSSVEANWAEGREGAGF